VDELETTMADRIKEAREELQIKRMAQEQREKALRGEVDRLEKELEERLFAQREVDKARSYSKKVMAKLDETE
jgi:hypothetical protein